MNPPGRLHPIDSIAQALAIRRIRLPEALRRLEDPSVREAFDPELLRRMLNLATRLERERRWRHAVPLLLVVAAAADRAPRPLSPGLQALLAEVFVRGIAVALWHVPDPRLYREALQRGTAALAAAHAASDVPAAGEVALALGILHLEPYTTHRGVGQAEAVRREWRRLLHEGDTWDGEPAPESGDGPFPGPAEALRLAEGYLRSAVESLAGERRIHALKALLAAADALTALGFPFPAEDRLRLGLEMARGWDPEQQHPRLVETLARLHHLGHPPDPELLDRALAPSPEHLLQRYGPGDATQSLVQLASLLVGAARAPEALDLLRRADPVLDRHARDATRRDWFMACLDAYETAWGGGFEVPGEIPVRELLPGLIQDRGETAWPLQRHAAVTLRLARHALRHDEADLGLLLLEKLGETLEPAPVARAARALRGLLWWQRGDQQAESPDTALDAHAQALTDALAVGDAQGAEGRLHQLAEDVTGASPQGIQALSRHLAPLVLPLESLLPDRGPDGVRQAVGAALQRLVTAGPEAAVAHDLLRLVHGCRFGAQREAGTGRGFLADRRIRSLLDRIRDLERRNPATVLCGSAGDPLTALGERTMLSPQGRTDARFEGATAKQEYDNLLFQLDGALDDALRAGIAPDDALRAVRADTLPDVLDADTVLVELFLARRGNSEILILFARTDGDGALRMVMGGEGSAPGTWVSREAAVELGNTAALVLNLRARLQEDPSPGEATSGPAREVLAEGARLLLEPLARPLAHWHALGRRHLCLVPHGPLRYAPLHLLPVSGRPLAEDWIVTYLPGFHVLLDRPTTAGPSAGSPGTALGIDFTAAHPWDLAPIPEAATEAREVAAAMKGRWVPPAEATPDAVLEALRHSRWLHLATHAAHHPLAAWSQRFFCAPGPDGRACLCAHELLGIDLRGLDLVTLSACSTALGRFDRGDNPRGLPAALLLAGVRTVIGALWEVGSYAATTFFVTFYARLRDTGDKRLAFRAAQEATRATHPETRDWGAFQLVGDWR